MTDRIKLPDSFFKNQSNKKTDPQTIVKVPKLNIKRRDIKIAPTSTEKLVPDNQNSEVVENKTEPKATSLKKAQVTFVPNVFEPENFETWSLLKALRVISNGKYKEIINGLRSLSNADYDREKMKLPAFCFNGIFFAKVTNANFKQSSCIILLDLDGLNSATIEGDKARIAKIPSVLFCFVSPSGTGLKVGLRVAPGIIKNDADFKHVLIQVNMSFDKMGFKIDPACKDVRRLCFVSHDPAIYVNWDAEEFVVEQTKEKAPLTSFLPPVLDAEIEAKKINECVAILRAATSGERHKTRFDAGFLGGRYAAGGQVDAQKMLDALIAASDSIADSGITSNSETKTLLDAFERGKNIPIYPTKESFNETLDTERIECKADLLSHVGDDHLLKRISIQLAKETKLPVNTVFLVGLAVYSSMAARGFVVLYENRQVLPLGLYVVVEQPSGAGKTRCINYFKQPFRRIQKEAELEVKERIESLSARSKKQKLSDAEQAELSELNILAEYLKSDLFTTNPTPEGLESMLHGSNGYFCVASSEQGLFNALFGFLYSSSKSSNNNDVVLNGFDGGHISTARVGRKGYNGFVVGSVISFAQTGSIEKLLAASNGTGLAERFLMLAEMHGLGTRDHTAIVKSDPDLTNKYFDACEFFRCVVGKRVDLHNLIKLVIPESGFHKIKLFQNQIEPHLRDGGKFSHISLRGAASKIDMQIMKIAAILYVLDRTDWDANLVISNEYVISAIGVAYELLEANLKLCKDKGIIGIKAEFNAVINYLTKKSGSKSERDLLNSLRGTLPFRDYTGDKPELIRSTLSEMVDQNLLRRTVDSGGKSSYCLAQ